MVDFGVVADGLVVVLGAFRHTNLSLHPIGRRHEGMRCIRGVGGRQIRANGGWGESGIKVKDLGQFEGLEQTQNGCGDVALREEEDLINVGWEKIGDIPLRGVRFYKLCTREQHRSRTFVAWKFGIFAGNSRCSEQV